MAAGFKDIVQRTLSAAGINVNGDEPWDIQVADERFYQRVIKDGSLGLGESYMDGWWDCGNLDDFFAKLVPAHPEKVVKRNWRILLEIFGQVVLNPGRRSRAFQVGERHYDKGNDLFRAMLDQRMVYSCAYWKEAKNLDDAQQDKLDLICRKLGLKPGDKILDIGCGWGGLARYAAEKYGAEVVGITVSKEQVSFAREVCKGLPVEIRLQDYRDVDERFDYIVSVGMFEHVGSKNYRTYMAKVHSCLKDDGLYLLHTIGSDTSLSTIDPWVGSYIFPNSLLPSIKQISAAVEGLFVVEDFHNIGFNYYQTLMSWFKNFDSNWSTLEGTYDQRFYRMWKYYLLSSAGSFKARCLQVWQIVLSKEGVPCGYNPIR